MDREGDRDTLRHSRMREADAVLPGSSRLERFAALPAREAQVVAALDSSEDRSQPLGGPLSEM